MGLRYLPALDGGSPSQRQCRDPAQGDEQSEEPVLHVSYQPLTLCSGVTLVLLAVFVLLGNTKTDQTLGRSVALVAQPHPKCPFQVEASTRPSVLRLIPW